MTISNNPPAVETHAMAINDLYDEAKGILDGAGVQTAADADMVGKLLDMLRQARRAADDQRKVEKAPHDAAGKAVQETWTPLLAKCDLAAGAAKDALTPYLARVEAEQQAKAAEAREIAIAAQRAAMDALQATSGDLAGRENAEALLKDAKRATTLADRADRAKPQAAGETRAIGLRTSYQAEITDQTAFARWAWAHRRDECAAFFQDLADREGRRGPVPIPGVIVHTIRKAA